MQKTRLRKIGEGYYYNVFDVGNGRVVKKKKSAIRTFFYIMLSQYCNPAFYHDYLRVVNGFTNVQETYNHLQKIAIDMALLGSPTFLKHAEYSQDKVAIIRSVLSRKTDQEIQKIIDDFIVLTKELWTYGVADEIYNFTVNNGIDSKGSILLIDFNEISFEKEKVAEGIHKQVWLHSWSYSHLKPALQKYYCHKMNQEITIAELHRLWSTKL